MKHLYAFFLTIITSCLLIQAGPQQLDFDALWDSGKRAFDNGEYAIAEKAFTEARQTAKAQNNIPGEVKSLLRLKRIKEAQGDYYAAIEFVKVSITLAKQLPDYTAEDQLLDVGDLPDLYSQVQDRENAMAALDEMEQCAKELNTDFGYGYYNYIRAITLYRFKQYSEAADACILADEYMAKSDDPFAKEFISGPQLASNYLYLANRLEEAYKKSQEACRLAKDEIGTKSLEYAKALSYLANIEGLLGLFEDGKSHYIGAWETLREITLQDLKMLPANARANYWDNVNALVWRMAPYAIAGGFNEDEFTAKAYEALNFSKGLMLAVEKSTGQIIQESGNEEMLSLFAKEAKLRNDVARFQAEKDGLAVARAYASLDSIDHQLARLMDQANLEPVVPLATAQQLSSALKTNEALIDFTDYTKSDGTHAYCAFVIKNGQDNPKIIEAFYQAAVDSIFEASSHNPDLIYGPEAQALSHAVWHNIQPELDGISTVYMVPSGLIHQLAVETLAPKKVVRLSSARQLLNQKALTRIDNPTTAVLYGGLNYDMSADEMMAEASAYSNLPMLSLRGLEIERGDSLFHALPYSKSEVEETGKILASKGMNVKILTGNSGTEESFVCLSGDSPAILLLSTHGFYYSPERVPSWSSLQGYDDAMHLTGIVLSGGNAEWMGRTIPDGVMGGILTSADIANLDLSGTELAVLSACNTALGRVSNEGVFGLQRAFKKAGVQTLVMSLWPVNDQAAKDFMVEFYRNLADNVWNKRQAFDAARSCIKEKYPEPSNWAAFIMLD